MMGIFKSKLWDGYPLKRNRFYGWLAYSGDQRGINTSIWDRLVGGLTRIVPGVQIESRNFEVLGMDWGKLSFSGGCRQAICFFVICLRFGNQGSLAYPVLGNNLQGLTRTYSISQEICTWFCCALLCCGYAIVHNEFTWSIYPYSSGLLCWHWGNR